MDTALKTSRSGNFTPATPTYPSLPIPSPALSQGVDSWERSTIMISPAMDVDNDKDTPKLAPDTAQVPTQNERKKRTRTGCLNCSRRRRKCDEAKPVCTGCKRRGDKCQWRMLGSFRDANIKVLESDHPSMSQGVNASKNKRQSRFKILNTVPISPRSRRSNGESEIIRVEQHPHSPSPTSQDTVNGWPAYEAAPESRSTSQIQNANVDIGQALSPLLSGDASSHRSQPSQPSPHRSIGDNSTHLHQNEANGQVPYSTNIQCDFRQPSLPDDASSHAHLNSSPEYVIDDLTALRGLTHSTQFHSPVTDSYQAGPSSLFDHSVFSDPADFANDVFLPGSAYEALHTTLRNRQLWTARPDIPSRRSSRGSVPQVRTPSDFNDADTFIRAEKATWRSRSGRFFELSPEREHILWQNYLNEICSWVSQSIPTI